MTATLDHYTSLSLLGRRIRLSDRGPSDTGRGVALAGALALTGLLVPFLAGWGEAYGVICAAAILSCSAVTLWRGTERSLDIVRDETRAASDRIGNLALAVLALQAVLAGLIVAGAVGLLA